LLDISSKTYDQSINSQLLYHRATEDSIPVLNPWPIWAWSS